MTLVFWIVVLTVFLGFFFWATNLLKTEAEEERFDAGLAILEFGRAYPDEAIRNVVMSSDAGMVFLRLWTGRTGIMRRIGNRELCHVVDPAEVRVSAASSGQALSIEFPSMKSLSGTFNFRSPREAAEVSLWILGSMRASIEPELKLPSPA
jgi:hypothetical protein